MLHLSRAIEEPLVLVQDEFAKDRNVTPSFLGKIYHDLCEDTTQLAKIKSLNVNSVSELDSGSLVHFRCMVQDMYDPELFCKTYNVCNKKTLNVESRCGLYQDMIHCNEDEEFDADSPQNEYGDRQLLYCVPIPGENDWSKKAHDSKFAACFKSELGGTKELGTKRKFEDDMSKCSLEAAPTSDVEAEEGRVTKKARSDDCKNTDTACYLFKENLSNKLPNKGGHTAIVKVYDVDVKVNLNDCLDVFGILSLDPTSTEEDDATDDDARERVAKNPCPSIVPRVHALVVKKSRHPHGLCPVVHDVGSKLEKCRGDLLTIFEHCFGGDVLAAEYLLYNLLSSVYARREGLALGKFSLNISRVPSSTFVDDFHQLLTQILHKCLLLEMSLKNMNGLSFVPRKDYDENRLRPGTLQLSDRTHLVVDETRLQAGKLEEKGVLNMTALADLMERQEVNYDFKYYNHKYPSNIRILILSEGKSILKCDCHVPLVESQQSKAFDSIKSLLTDSVLDPIRAYLSYVENLDVDLPEEVREEIGKDFVEGRKSGEDAMAPEDLHFMLTLTRYVALSHGSTVVDRSHWSRARDVERIRKQRLK